MVDTTPLIVKATSFVRLEKRCTVSLLQRKYNLSFLEAVKLIDALEENGVVRRHYANGVICDVIDAAEPRHSDDAGTRG
jgi:DNA segregation ATPase FtsK/SpoIIIE-like protein